MSAARRLEELRRRAALIGGVLTVRIELDERISYLVRHHPPHGSIQHYEFDNLDALESWISRKPVIVRPAALARANPWARVF